MHLITFADYKGIRLVTLGVCIGKGGEKMNVGGIFFPYLIVTLSKKIKTFKGREVNVWF